MKRFTFLLVAITLVFSLNSWSQSTIIDFETDGDGYTPSATEGTLGDYMDIFNRSNPNIGSNATYMWAVEDISLSNPSITLDQIDITGASSFTFSMDMIAHHYNDWDNNDELLVTFSIDGGAYQNLMWVQNTGEQYNDPAALDTDFDGDGECVNVLPALTTGTGTDGCVVSSNIFETFTSASIPLGSNATLDIILQFNGLTATDEGIYLDNITITPAFGGNNPPSISSVAHSPSSDINSTTTVSVSADVTDSDGTVDLVELNWGIVSGVLTNTITMSNGGSGDTYTTVTDIPAQSDGTTVYYQVYAEDDLGDDSSSPEYNYTVNDPATTTIPYSETFDTDLGDCYTYSVTGPTKEWYWNSGGYAYMSGYNSGVTEEDWLVLPGIDFDSYANETMTFDTWYKYGTDDINNYLKLYYSADYPGIGDPSNGYTWVELTFTHPSTAETWTSSGSVDLSAITGTMVYIAFKYNYEAGSYRNWGVDNLSIIEGNPPLVADFEADQTSVMPGTTVNFTDLTTGGVTTYSYEWDLDGDGDFGDSFDQNPSFLYSTAGTYDISLRVTDNDIPASVDTETKLAYITVVNIPNLLISEVADPGDHYQGRFVEIYNAETTTVDFSSIDIFLVKQTNGGNLYDIQLTGSILPGETHIVANNSGDFTTYYGFAPDQSSGSVSGNGDDGYFLYFGGGNATGTLFDSYGVLGVDGTGEDWEYENSHAVRHRDVLVPNSTWTASEWTIMFADVDDMTPKAHRETRIWQGTLTSEWRSKGTNWDGTYGYIPDASDNTEIPDVSKAAFPIITGSATCMSLYIASNAKLEIASTGSLSVLGSITNNADTTGIVLRADASGYATLMHNTNGVDATVESYISADAWHGVSSPMTDAESRVFLGLYLTWFQESDSTWQWVEATDYGLDAGKGLFTWSNTNNATVNYYGNLNNGDVNPAISYSTGAYTGIGWNLIGNPFPSAVEWTSNWGQTNVDATMYVFDAANGQYDTWNYSTSSGTNGKTNGDIAVGQAIWIKANAASPSVTVPQSERKHSTEPFYKSTNIVDGRLSFIVAGNGKSDEMVVYFRDDATNEFDSQFDAWKLFAMGMETPNLYSISNGNKLAVNVLPFDNNVIPAGFKPGVNGVYTISVNDLENIGDDIIVYLEDLKENQMINLSELLSYSFTASVSDDPNRFLLHFGYFTGNNEFTNTENINIFAYDKTIYIKSGELLSGEAIIYDLTGKEILRKSINQSDFEKINVSNLSGYYLVSFVSNESIVNQKVFIK